MSIGRAKRFFTLLTTRAGHISGDATTCTSLQLRNHRGDAVRRHLGTGKKAEDAVDTKLVNASLMSTTTNNVESVVPPTTTNAVAVVLHSLGAFLGGGNLGLGIAAYHSTWNILQAWELLDQGYFMCVFCFISAYSTPTSCDRKGQSRVPRRQTETARDSIPLLQACAATAGLQFRQPGRDWP